MNRPGETKPPIHLIPDYLLEIAEVMGHGKREHSDNDWQSGLIPPWEFTDAAIRHLLAIQRGELLDHSGHPHAAHAASDAMIAGVLLRPASEPDLEPHERVRLSEILGGGS